MSIIRRSISKSKHNKSNLIKDIDNLNHKIRDFDAFDTYRMLHPTVSEYTHFFVHMEYLPKLIM